MITPEERLGLMERQVRGLAREVEAARTAQEALAGKAQLVELKGQLVKLADQVADLPNLLKPPAPAEAEPVGSWLAQVPDDFTPAEVLTDLVGWLRTVYLRYADGVKGLPECWLWHPEVIEELLWLMQAWRAAYLGEPSIRAVGDWHDRLRPGVVRRVEAYTTGCSLASHQRPTPDPASVPAADAIGPIAEWWAGDHDQQAAPVPTAEQLDAADRAAFNGRTRYTAGGQS